MPSSSNRTDAAAASSPVSQASPKPTVTSLCPIFASVEFKGSLHHSLPVFVTTKIKCLVPQYCDRLKMWVWNLALKINVRDFSDAAELQGSSHLHPTKLTRMLIKQENICDSPERDWWGHVYYNLLWDHNLQKYWFCIFCTHRAFSSECISSWPYADLWCSLSYCTYSEAEGHRLIPQIRTVVRDAKSSDLHPSCKSRRGSRGKKNAVRSFKGALLRYNFSPLHIPSNFWCSEHCVHWVNEGYNRYHFLGNVKWQNKDILQERQFSSWYFFCII